MHMRTDIDECAVNNGDCHTHAVCGNTFGSFTCTCRPGYTGDGVTCSGIYSSFSLPCSDFAFFLLKTDLLRSCSIWSISSCLRIGIRVRFERRYIVTSVKIFIVYLIIAIVGEPVSKYMPYVATDVDECAANNGGCHTQATCNNTGGNFTCTCHIGYTGDGFICTGKVRVYV